MKLNELPLETKLYEKIIYRGMFRFFLCLILLNFIDVFGKLILFHFFSLSFHDAVTFGVGIPLLYWYHLKINEE